MSSDEARRKFLTIRRSLDANYRAIASDAICRKLIRTRLFARSNAIAVYFAQADEVDLGKFIDTAWRCGKRVYAPVVVRKRQMFFSHVSRDSELCRSRYGIWEPKNGERIAAMDLDWVLMPVVAFDAALHRIGMGGGYYDRAFAFCNYRHRVLLPRLSGIAFACQETDTIVRNPWDIGVSRVFTES